MTERQLESDAAAAAAAAAAAVRKGSISTSRGVRQTIAHASTEPKPYNKPTANRRGVFWRKSSISSSRGVRCRLRKQRAPSPINSPTAMLVSCSSENLYLVYVLLVAGYAWRGAVQPVVKIAPA